MIILPAIDLYEKKAVRLFKGDYAQMTVYNDDPLAVAMDFKSCGCEYIHMVDLEGAKLGTTPNYDIIKSVVEKTSLKVEIGGGIRTMDTVDKYLDAGISRVILGTAAVTDDTFVETAVLKHGDKIAVGVDIKDGFVAIKGWTEKSKYSCMEFLTKMQACGVSTVICTDISKDGAMAGTNRELYKAINEKFSLNIIASGGVSSLNDITCLRDMGMYGAIIGKAYYTGAIDLKKAVEVSV